MRRLFPLAFAAALLLARAVSAETPEALVEEAARASFGPELPDGAEFAVTVQDPKPADAVMLSTFRMDRATGQFVANAVTPEGSVVRIAGLAVPTVAVPVPVRGILPDEIIGAADLRTVALPLGRVGAFVLTDPDALIGMQVRRVLAQGRPIMAQSVMQPLIIDRGDRVEIQFDDGLLALRAPGRALDDAHRGEEIRVVNLASNATLMAVAKADGIVEVSR